MSPRIESCRRGGYTIFYDTGYEWVLEQLEADDTDVLTTTTHLTVARIDGIKISITDGEISVKSDEREDAERVRARLFDQD